MSLNVLWQAFCWAAALICALLTWACWELAGEALGEQQTRAAMARARLRPPPSRVAGSPASFRASGAAFFLAALAWILVAR